MRRTRAVVAAGALAVVVLVGAVVVVRGDEPDLPEDEVRAFLGAWSKSAGARVDQLAVPNSGASADQARFHEELRISRSMLDLVALRRSQGGARATSTAVREGEPSPFSENGVLQLRA